MKRIIYTMLAAASLSLSSCEYDDKDVWNAINSQEERIAALENWQKTANENINALQALVNENDYITAVTPLIEEGETIGYTISFLKQGDVTIYNGEKGDKGEQGDKGETGDKGDMPLIGVVEQTDGRWYWTLNGELLKDADGNPICANGKDGEDGEDGTDGSNGSSGTSAPVPQLKTEGGIVYLSVDGGKNWKQVSGKNGDSFFNEAPTDNGNSWTFTLADETEITVPKYRKLSLYYQAEGETTQTIIKSGELAVSLNKAFSILCEPAENCKWTYRIEDKTIEPKATDKSLQFEAINTETSFTIKFTLTTPDNQAFFYLVKVNVGQKTVIENKELATALKGLGIHVGDDGTIEAEEIEKQSSLDLSGKQLTSLEGIEYFTNLEELNISNQKLITLDLSKLTKLKKLNCTNCFAQPTARAAIQTILDLSGNPDLEKVECRECGLTELNVTNCEKLTKLVCNDNLLTKINFNSNTALCHLECRNNKLTELNVSKNILLEALSCENNDLQELEVNSNKELNYLACGNPKLAQLDVSHNLKLQKLLCASCSLTKLNVENNESLWQLDCFGNQLTSLDVSSNPNLNDLNCGDNEITKLDLSNNTKLDILNCGSNPLTELNLTHTPNLGALNCSYCQLTTLDITPLTRIGNDFHVGCQQDQEKKDINLTLIVTEQQQQTWAETWINQIWNSNVTPQIKEASKNEPSI